MLDIKEFSKLLFDKYNTLLLNRFQTAEVINMSKSHINKLIADNKKNCLPKSKKFGKKVLFTSEAIYEYMNLSETK